MLLTVNLSHMPVTLTEEEFSKHLNTRFQIPSHEIALELTDVKGYLSQPHEQSGLERFSTFFQGPSDRFLPQATYSMDHEVMGSFDLFLVPIAKDESGFRYEAVFNYFKQQ